MSSKQNNKKLGLKGMNEFVRDMKVVPKRDTERKKDQKKKDREAPEVTQGGSNQEPEAKSSFASASGRTKARIISGTGEPLAAKDKAKIHAVLCREVLKGPSGKRIVVEKHLGGGVRSILFLEIATP